LFSVRLVEPFRLDAWLSVVAIPSVAGFKFASGREIGSLLMPAALPSLSPRTDGEPAARTIQFGISQPE
jgi:hypothetical protein